MEKLLAELQAESERMASHLKDRQPGLAAYTTAFHEMLANMHRLTSAALGKEV